MTSRLKQLRKLVAKYPDLSLEGWRTRKMDDARFEAKRIELTESLDQVETAIAFILANCSIRHYGKMRGSYGLKHVAENWGGDNGLSPYVANGALIAAALILEVPIRRSLYDSPNCSVSVYVRKRSMRRSSPRYGRTYL